MSSEDERVRPYHARADRDARGEEAADAVAAVMKHAADRDEAARGRSAPKKQAKWMLPLGINLAVFAVYLLIAPPQWVVMNPVEGPDPTSQVESLQTAMWLQAQQIDQYRLETGRLPDTLEDLPRDPVAGAIEYVREGSSYRLVAVVADAAIVYDPQQTDASFEATVRERMGAGG